MLMYGPASCANIRFSGTGVEYNFTSIKEGMNNLSLLIPSNPSLVPNDINFDIQYANYIMNNDNVFVEFFQIIYNLYLGNNVFIAVENDPYFEWAENLLESLMKLIQERYGYPAVKIESEEDYIFAESNFVGDFKDYGLYNLDCDKERFVALVSSGVQGTNKIRLE